MAHARQPNAPAKAAVETVRNPLELCMLGTYQSSTGKVKRKL